MRSFQKKLSATAAAAALLAALGAAFAQSTDPLDAHSATADRNANVSQGTQVKDFQGNDMSTNGPMATQAKPSTTAAQSSTTTSSPSVYDSSTSAVPTTTDNSAASNTTDNSGPASSSADTPSPRADRN